MSEQGADFDAKREAYEAAQGWLLDLIDRPDYAEPVSEYRAALKAALAAQQRAHDAMMEAWARSEVAVESVARSFPGYTPDDEAGDLEREINATCRDEAKRILGAAVPAPHRPSSPFPERPIYEDPNSRKWRAKKNLGATK